MNEVLSIKNVRGYMNKNTGTAYLNAEDVARGFGFTQSKNDVDYVRWDRVNDYLHEFGFSPRVGKDDFLPENMVYRLGFKANNEVAHKFQSFLADEVLPAIRKHGAYMTEQAIERAITEPDFLIRLATQLKEERAKREQAEQQIEQDRPKVLFAGAVSASHTSILIGDLAKLLKQNGYDTGQHRLFRQLRNEGFLMKSGSSRNMPTQRAMEHGLFEVKETTINNPDGTIRITKTPKVTGKGQVYFINRYLNRKEEKT